MFSSGLTAQNYQNEIQLNRIINLRERTTPLLNIAVVMPRF